jgi:hypothetical protein
MSKLGTLIFSDCKQSVYMIEKRTIEPLTRKERLRLKAHLAICQNCTRYAKQSAILEKIFSIRFNDEKPLRIIHNEKLKVKIKDSL